TPVTCGTSTSTGTATWTAGTTANSTAGSVSFEPGLKKKAAGGVLTAKQAPAGPAPPRRPVCAPATRCRRCLADQPGKGERTMSFPRWLQNLCPALERGRGQRRHRGRGAPRAATHRPSFEALEDRCLPTLGPVTSFPVGTNPPAVVTADFNHDGR